MTDDKARLRGALGGSLLFEQPRYAEEAAAYRAACATGRPTLLEVGFDHGFRLLATAQHNPGWQVVGLEIRRHRVDIANARAQRAGLSNLLAWRADARTVLAALTPDACLDVLEVLFPDPWWNAAHRQKRLLLTRPFLDEAARALKPGGLMHLATDVPRYAAEIEAVLADHPAFAVDPAALAQRPPCPAQSRREWKCEREAIAVHRFAARRRP